MPQTATVEIKIKAGKEEISDKAEYEIGGYVAVMEEVVCACAIRDVEIDVFGGPANLIDLIFVKSDAYTPQAANGNGNGRACTNEKYDHIEVCLQHKKVDADGKVTGTEPLYQYTLKKALFLGSECIKPLGAKTIDSIKIRNPLPRDVKISVLVVRQKKEVPPANNPAGLGQNRLNPNVQQALNVPAPAGT